jgi:hypothetical protein
VRTNSNAKTAAGIQSGLFENQETHFILHYSFFIIATKNEAVRMRAAAGVINPIKSMNGFTIFLYF